MSYTYASDNPVNAIDPNGLDCSIFSFVCAGYDTVAGGVKTAAIDTGHFFSDPSRWRDEANYWAGFGNGIVSTFTFGQAHISAPYCDALSWAYGVGNGFGYATAAVGTAAAGEALIESTDVEGEFGGRGVHIHYDETPHGNIGSHLQIDTWQKGVSGSGQSWRIPWPPWSR